MQDAQPLAARKGKQYNKVPPICVTPPPKKKPTTKPNKGQPHCLKSKQAHMPSNTKPAAWQQAPNSSSKTGHAPQLLHLQTSPNQHTHTKGKTATSYQSFQGMITDPNSAITGVSKSNGEVTIKYRKLLFKGWRRPLQSFCSSRYLRWKYLASSSWGESILCIRQGWLSPSKTLEEDIAQVFSWSTSIYTSYNSSPSFCEKLIVPFPRWETLGAWEY